MVDRTSIVVVAEAADEGERADVVVARHRAELSRRTVRELALRGRLWIDGMSSPPSTRIRAGARLELRLRVPDDPLPPLRTIATTPRFVYVDKPAGVHTHRLGPEDPPALSDAVTRVFPECAQASEHPREGGAIHRLDAPTSGVLAFARTRRAWTEGRRAIAQSAVKIYIAVVDGPWPPIAAGVASTDAATPSILPEWAPPPSEDPGLDLTWALGPGAAADVVTSRADGHPARTRAWSLARNPSSAAPRWLALRLLTGRRHQARVHLATAGAPIVGDERYGGAPYPTLLLRAAVLELDARDGPVVAPAPDDWPRP